MRLCKEYCHANIGTDGLHSFNKSVGRLTGCGDVINNYDILATEEILIDLVALFHSVCKFVHMADMDFLTMTINDDMSKAIHSTETFRQNL